MGEYFVEKGIKRTVLEGGFVVEGCGGACPYDKYYDRDRFMMRLGSKNLTVLNSCIGKYNDLTRLYLGNNNLTSLPESIGNLSALTHLNLYNNNLTSLPESIRNLDKKGIVVNILYNNFTEDYKTHIKEDLFPLANSVGFLYL